MVIRRQPILALTVALVALLAVVGFASAVAAENDALEPLTIETGAGAHTVMVEIADTPEERGVGLMHRTELMRPTAACCSTSARRGRSPCG